MEGDTNGGGGGEAAIQVCVNVCVSVCVEGGIFCEFGPSFRPCAKLLPVNLL